MKKKLFIGILYLITISMFAQLDYNKLDEKGNKNGLWKGYYPETKNLKYEGTFEHGKEVGVFNFYDNTKTKRVIATREFNPTDNSAYTIMYDQLKNKVSEGKVINKLPEGKWIYYHKSSNAIMATENYAKGKLEGMRNVFYPNGKIAEEIVYVNNLKNGPYRRYTVAGIVIEESNYKDGEYDGVTLFRDPDSGKIVSKGVFTKGKKTGIWQFYQKDKPVKEINMSSPQSTSSSKK